MSAPAVLTVEQLEELAKRAVRAGTAKDRTEVVLLGPDKFAALLETARAYHRLVAELAAEKEQARKDFEDRKLEADIDG